jgi:hypothetical protein
MFRRRLNTELRAEDKHLNEGAMCQIQNLLTQTPKEHLVVTDSSPKVHNAVLAAPMPIRSASALQAQHKIARTPEMRKAR